MSSKEVLSFSDALRSNISNTFNIPTLLLEKPFLDSNGFSGCGPVIGSDSRLEAYSHWSRFLIKQTFDTLRRKRSFIEHQPTGAPIHGSRTAVNGWVWFEMGFFVNWRSPHRTTIVCINAPNRLQDLLELTLKQCHIEYNDPYSLHCVLLDQVIKLYDTSVWSMRNHACSAEASRTEDRDFPLLHEVARHMIHVSETLAVAVQSVEGLRQQHEEFMMKEARQMNPWSNTQCRLQLQQRMLQSLYLRSESNKARVQDEITLAFNAAAQRDNRLQVHIGQQVNKETAAMKVIAVGTLTFLPATFVSSLFSTSFFDFQPANGDVKEMFTVSDKFWMYWVLAAPLSTMMLLIWLFWEERVIKHSMETWRAYRTRALPLR